MLSTFVIEVIFAQSLSRSGNGQLSRDQAHVAVNAWNIYQRGVRKVIIMNFSQSVLPGKNLLDEEVINGIIYSRLGRYEGNHL